MQTDLILGVCFLSIAFSSLIPGDPDLLSFCHMEGAFDAVTVHQSQKSALLPCFPVNISSHN